MGVSENEVYHPNGICFRQATDDWAVDLGFSSKICKGPVTVTSQDTGGSAVLRETDRKGKPQKEWVELIALW